MNGKRAISSHRGRLCGTPSPLTLLTGQQHLASFVLLSVSFNVHGIKEPNSSECSDYGSWMHFWVTERCGEGAGTMASCTHSTQPEPSARHTGQVSPQFCAVPGNFSLEMVLGNSLLLLTQNPRFPTHLSL